MVSLPEISDLSPDAIKAKIRSPFWKQIILNKTVDSTNTVASGIAEKAEESTIVLADSQTKGRGRLGRLWISPPGVSIYMSIILKPLIDICDVTFITIMAAVACANALRKSTNLNVTIKWPNDLVCSGKKIGGILTELKIEHNRLIYAVTGIGINVNADINTFPADVRDIATTVKNETGKVFRRTDIIADILNETEKWYIALNKGDKDTIISEWKRLDSTLGKEVLVITASDTLSGIAELIDEKGMLMLRLPSGQLKRITTGDLKILR